MNSIKRYILEEEKRCAWIQVSFGTAQFVLQTSLHAGGCCCTCVRSEPMPGPSSLFMRFIFHESFPFKDQIDAVVTDMNSLFLQDLLQSDHTERMICLPTSGTGFSSLPDFLRWRYCYVLWKCRWISHTHRGEIPCVYAIW